MFLQRLKLRTRIYAGFGAVLLCCLIVAGVGVWGLAGVRAQSALLVSVPQNLARVLETRSAQDVISRTMLAARDDDNPALRGVFSRAQEDTAARMQAAIAASPSAERIALYKEVLRQLPDQRAAATLQFDAVEQMAASRSTLTPLGDSLSAAAS